MRDASQLVDSHCHLDLPAFDADRATVLARASHAGVRELVIPAVSASRWPSLLKLCQRHHQLHPALGMHPMFMAAHRPEHAQELEPLLDDPRVIAVGECGLDFYHGRTHEHAQRKLLMAQLEMARSKHLPVILHARKALQDVMQCLKAVGGLRGVVHSFSGSPEQARQLWELGFHLGIGGVVTYPRAQRLRRVVAGMPAQWLLLETDSPDQPLCGLQGQRNEPAQLPTVLACVAELRGDDPAELAARTSANARALFGLA